MSAVDQTWYRTRRSLSIYLSIYLFLSFSLSRDSFYETIVVEEVNQNVKREIGEPLKIPLSCSVNQELYLNFNVILYYTEIIICALNVIKISSSTSV